MRALKRQLNYFLSETRIAARRNQVAAEIQAHFGVPLLRLTPAGARGHDSTYIVEAGDKTLGVLRLVNPYRNRPVPGPDMPFTLGAPMARLEREWTSYEQAGPSGLTPQPLWRAHDALLCSHIPHRPLHDALLKSPDRAWKLLIHAARRLFDLHQLGMTHMDTSMANILADDGLNELVFIDFEYAPAAHVPPPAQRLYDHLRLVESTWKFIPKKQRADSAAWLDAFVSCLDEGMRAADLRLLAPALPRILSAPEFTPGLLKALGRD